MADEEKQKEIDNYLEQVKLFNEIRPEEAERLIEVKDRHIVYIGRETCPYCRRFIRTLSELVKEHDFIVHYVHSKNPESVEEVDRLRKKYDVPTVPGLIYSSETAGLVVKCDSSLTPEEILDIIEIS